MPQRSSISYKRTVHLLALLSCLHSSPLSPAAEVFIPVCWYTLDTTLKLISSGFVADILHRMRELKKHDALINDYLAYIEAQEKSTAVAPETCVSTPVCQVADEAPQEIICSPVAEFVCSTSIMPRTKTPAACTDLIIGGVNAADQFLKPGEIFDHETGTRTFIYHDDRGHIGIQSDIGNSRVRIGTDAVSIFNFVYALGNWLFPADDDTHTLEYNSTQVLIKKTPVEKEAIHLWCLQRLKTNLAERLPHWRDEPLDQRANTVQGWRAIQEKALKKYNAYLAIAETPERIAQLTEAKRSAEQYIENFDAELDAIQREQNARAQKQNSQSKQPSYADDSCNSASPGGKDPRDKDKNERYNGPKYSSMNEVFKKEKIGQRLQECSERIEGEKFKGAQVYRVKKDMPELGLYENDVFYLDSYHGDHIEAFRGNREGTPRNVLSVDGRSLLDKLKKAIQDGRTYRPSR